MEGQGDLVSRLVTPTSLIIPPSIPIAKLLTKSQDPPSSSQAWEEEGGLRLHSASWGLPSLPYFAGKPSQHFPSAQDEGHTIKLHQYY